MRYLLGYPGHGFPPFSAEQVFWLNCPAIIASILSLCGSMFIIIHYLYTSRVRTLVHTLVAWLSFSDLCLVLTMAISITTATSQGQVAYIYAEDWYPIIQITNFFITAGWLWSAAIAFASLNMGSFTHSQDRERKVMNYIHTVVWGLSFVITAILTLLNDVLKEPTIALRIQTLFGLFIYIWNIVLLIFVLTRIRVITREFIFIEEKKKMRNMMISLIVYLIPFIVCWSVFIVCGMITFKATFNSHYAQEFGFWTLIFMICPPPLQGAMNALAFGLTTFDAPRLFIVRMFNRILPKRISRPYTVNVSSDDSEEAPIVNYDEETEDGEGTRSYKSIKSIPPPKNMSVMAAPTTHPHKESAISAPIPYASSVYLIYFNSFLYYFSLGMKLMVKWTYMEVLGGSLFDFGCTMAAFGLGWAISAVPSAMWARKFNTKQVLYMTTFLSLIGSILWAFATTPAMLILSRFMTGLAAGNITVGRSFLAMVATPETRTIIMANSSAASMVGSVLGPLLSLALAYTPEYNHYLGKLPVRFSQYTYPGWVIIFICICYMILLRFFFHEPGKNSSASVQPPKLTAPIIICGALVCLTLCMLSFFETISLPIMIIIFGWTIPQACAVWIGVGTGSFLVQLVGIRIMNQQLKVEDRFGIFLGLCIGLFGSLVLTGFTWQCNITSMLIGSIAIICISGAFLFTFSLALIAKFLGRVTIHYLGHVFAAGAVGRVIGPMWAVAASSKFSTVGLSLDGVDSKDLNTLLPFAGCSILLLAALIVIQFNYKKLLPT